MSREGRVVAICIGTVASGQMVEVQSVTAIAGAGLDGDRYCLGKGSYNRKEGVGHRQVTLINGRFFEGSGFEFVDSRRNLVTEGVELMEFIGQEFTVGEARLRGLRYCDPCLRPGVLSGKTASFREAFFDRGGLVAEILSGGLIEVGGPVVPPPRKY